jgi:hypothetical protein
MISRVQEAKTALSLNLQPSWQGFPRLLEGEFTDSWAGRPILHRMSKIVASFEPHLWAINVSVGKGDETQCFSL